MDKEYIVLEEINGNNNISQRKLAEKTGLSLGSINMLLKKMLKEGLIKIENIPANRVVYMLTPKGIVEKANKTYTYIKHHYSYIHKTKEKIKNTLYNQIHELGNGEKIYVLLNDDEISELMKTSIMELELNLKDTIHVFYDNVDLSIYRLGFLVVSNNKDYKKYYRTGCKVINIIEKL